VLMGYSSCARCAQNVPNIRIKMFYLNNFIKIVAFYSFEIFYTRLKRNR